MARYSDFTMDSLREQLGMNDKVVSLFPNDMSLVHPSDWLIETLNATRSLPKRSEKARSEAVVFPILLELRKRNDEFFNIYSGENLNVDTHLGLKGECDFIIGENQHTYSITHPIMAVVEAKKGDIDLGVAQCAAQLFGAQRFNSKNQDTDADNNIVYGCVTTADEWLFMKLVNNTLFINDQKIFIDKLPLILGGFQYIINFYKH